MLSAVGAGTRLHRLHDGIPPTGAEAFGLLTAFDAGCGDHPVRFRNAMASDYSVLRFV